MKARVGLSVPGGIIRNSMFDQYHLSEIHRTFSHQFNNVMSFQTKKRHISLPGLFCFCSFKHFTYLSVKEILSEFKMQFSDDNLIY